MTPAAFPHQKQRRRVLDREMAYVEVGQGAPNRIRDSKPTSGRIQQEAILG